MGTYSGKIYIRKGPGTFSVVSGGQTLASGVTQYTVSGKNDITITTTNKIASYSTISPASKTGTYSIRINVTGSSDWIVDFSITTGYGYALKDGTTTVASGVAASVTLPSRSKTGYTFLGWASNSTSSVAEYAAGATWDLTSEGQTLYAVWALTPYTVTLNDNGGSGGVGSVTATYGSAMPQLGSVPARAGHVFEGYWTLNNGAWGDKYYNANGSSARNWDYPGNSTLYARWTAIPYTVNFYDGFSGALLKSETVYYGGSATPPPVPAHEGYTFAGWSGAYTNVTSDQTVTATWSVVQRTIYFDSNGGSPVASITAPYGTALTRPADPTKAGYVFAGWTPAFPPTMPANDLTLTATWSEHLCELGYDNIFHLIDWFNYARSSSLYNPALGTLGKWQYANGSVVIYGSQQDYADVYTYFSRDPYAQTGVHVFGVNPALSPYTVSCDVGFYKTGGSGSGWDSTDHPEYNAHYGAAATSIWMFFFDANGNYIPGADARCECPESPPQGAGGNIRRINANVSVPQNAAVAALFFEAVVRSGERAEFTGIRVIDSYRGSFAPWQTRFVYTYVKDHTYAQQVDYRTSENGLNLLGSVHPSRSGYVFKGWKYNDGTDVNEGSLVVPTSRVILSQWAKSVSVSMSSSCDGGSPTGAGTPNVKIGENGAKGASAGASAVVDDLVTVYASAGVTGLDFSNFRAVDAQGRVILSDTATVADVTVDGEAMKSASFYVQYEADITVSAVYTKKVVAATVNLSEDSSGVGSNLLGVEPDAVTRRFGDTVTFRAEDATDYAFFGWSTASKAAQGVAFLQPNTEAYSNGYQVTLAADMTLYAHYARTIAVEVVSLESDGVTPSADVGGSVSVSLMGQLVATPGTAFKVPLGGVVRIVSTADTEPEGEFRFAGVEFLSPGGSAVAKDFGADESFLPEGNGTYRVKFQKSPPFVYLACADVAETGATGANGVTTASYSGGIEGDFAEVDAEEVPANIKAGVPSDARWYKVRQNASVSLAARRASSADALEWKDWADASLPLAQGGHGRLGSGGDNASEQPPVWEWQVYVMTGSTLVTTTWGVYPSPTVTLGADVANGGSVRFADEDAYDGPRAFPATYDSETGEYSYMSATVVAQPSPDGGFMFRGWIERRGGGSTGQLVSTDLEYTFEVRSDVTLVALFRADPDAVYKWEGGAANKTLEWSSGVITLPKPGDPVAVRVDATGYPAAVDVGTYSSPYAEPTRQHAVSIVSQDGRRLPRRRPERFWKITVRADYEVDALVAATNVAEVN